MVCPNSFFHGLQPVNIINQSNHQQDEGSGRKTEPPMQIESTGTCACWKGQRHQARGVHSQNYRQTAAAGRGMFVRPAFIRQVHDAEPAGQFPDQRGQQVGDHQRRQERDNVFVKFAKHLFKS